MSYNNSNHMLPLSDTACLFANKRVDDDRYVMDGFNTGSWFFFVEVVEEEHQVLLLP